jgi:two-component system sensor histidine kinase HydH
LHPVDVAKVVFHVCDLLRPEAAARGIEIVPRIPETLPRVSADEAQLMQALVNLVINAVQAVGGNGRVQVNASMDARDGELSIQVVDTGPGVPADKQSAIFEPFFTTKAEGSGLGLWIVQQIITAHGGSVHVSNPAGGGAAFEMRLKGRKEETSDG